MRFLAAEGGKILGVKNFELIPPLVFGRSETRGELIQGIQLMFENISLPDLRWVAISLVFVETFLLQNFRSDNLFESIRDLNVF